MTIQLLQPFNGLMPGVYSNLGASEEARLVALPGAMARYYTPGMDGYDPRLSDSQESAVQALVSGAGNGYRTVLFGDSMVDTYETIVANAACAYNATTGDLTVTSAGHQQAV